MGLLLGVCTLQILMKPAISMIRAMPISRTAHQCAWMEIIETGSSYRDIRLGRERGVRML